MAATPTISTPCPIEKHYKIRDLEERLGLSYEAVRQLVMFEPGVVVLAPIKPQSKRRTRNTYLIPESVILRILRRSTNPAVPITSALSTRQLQRVAA